jgi:hypothetical protein
MATPFDSAIAALEQELHDLEGKVFAARHLIEMLRLRAGTPTPEPKVAPSPATTQKKQNGVAAPKRRKGGRPPLDPADQQRARKAAQMRARRQRLREEAARAAAAIRLSRRARSGKDTPRPRS